MFKAKVLIGGEDHRRVGPGGTQRRSLDQQGFGLGDGNDARKGFDATPGRPELHSGGKPVGAADPAAERGQKSRRGKPGQAPAGPAVAHLVMVQNYRHAPLAFTASYRQYRHAWFTPLSPRNAKYGAFVSSFTDPCGRRTLPHPGRAPHQREAG